jgi:hypothetical protein
MGEDLNAKVSSPRQLFIILLLLGVLFHGIFYYVLHQRFHAGLNDFMAFYSSGKLAFTGKLYDFEAIWEAQKAATNGDYGPDLVFVRLPFYAALLWPFAQLPYLVSWWTFFSTCVAALWAGTRLLPAPEPARLKWGWLICSLPAGASLLNGQDVAFTFLALIAGAALYAKKQHFAAGLLWSLLAIKPHLFVFLPVILLLRRNWSVILGGVTGGAGLLAMSFLLSGPDWPQKLMTVLQQPALHAWQIMPNIYVFGGDALQQSPTMLKLCGVLTGAVLILALWQWEKRVGGWLPLFAIPPASILITTHVYVSDCVLIFPFAMWLLHEAQSKLQRLLAFALLVPPIYVGLLMGPPVAFLAPAVLLAALLSFPLSGRPSSR